MSATIKARVGHGSDPQPSAGIIVLARPGDGAPGAARTDLHSRRWIILIALLVVEVFVLTVRFEAGGHLPNVLRGLPHLGGQLLVAIATGAWLVHRLGGARIMGSPDGAAVPHRAGPYIVAHFVALAIFTWLTAIVLEGGARPLLPALGWAFAWGGMGFVTAVCWLAIGDHPSRWLRLSGGGFGLLLGGAAIGLAVWGAGRIAEGLWAPLGHSTLWVAYQLLSLLVDSPTCRPAEFAIGTPNFAVTIAPPCSGYEGMGLVLILIGSYLWLARRRLRFPQALILLPIGVGVIWLANAVRIALLVVLGSKGFGSVAMGGFHSQAGWLAFDAVGLGLIAASGRWAFVQADPRGRDAGPSACPTMAYLAPLLAILGATMVTAAFSDGFDRLYPIRILAGAGVLWHYRRQYGELRRAASWQAMAIGIAAFAIWMALEPSRSAGEIRVADPWIGLAGASRGWVLTWLVLRVVGSVAVIPVAEELAFRAYLTRRLIDPHYWRLPIGAFTWPSFLISSALFGALHGRWLAGMLVGMLYALALYRRRDPTDAVLAHAITNALVAAAVFATGNWALWT